MKHWGIGIASFFVLMQSGTSIAGDAASCLNIRQKQVGQVLVNMCSDTVEAGWCVAAPGNPYRCNQYDNRANIRPGSEYPVARGYVSFGACAGANSIRQMYPGPRYDCD